MLVLILGGARSGKSALAEELAHRAGGDVTYLATCPRIEGDDELADRIEQHRRDRPPSWRTIEEELDLGGAIDSAPDGFLVVDCLTLWVANLQYHGRGDDEIAEASQRALAACRRRTGDTVAVSNEVGLGIVPADPATRAYRDALGHVNRDWARAADRSLFLVAGRALPLRDPDELLR